MQHQTIYYKPFSSVREVDMSIRFELVDINAKPSSIITVNEEAAISNTSQLKDEIYYTEEKWATLEQDFWRLDGTFDVLPDDTELIQTGWWGSSLSGSDKTFATNPVLSVNFGGISVSTVGFTLWFDDKVNQYPSSIKVTTYQSDGTTIIDQETHTCNSAKCVIDMPSSEYYYVTFEFLNTTEAYRRIKLYEIDFGIIQNFDRDTLTVANIVYGASISAENIPSRELTFTFDNSDKKYNLLNPEGIYAYLQEGQEIKANIFINNESVNMGTFYFTKAEAKDGALTAQITANDAIIRLESTVYNGGSNTTKTLSEGVDDVLSGLNIPVVYKQNLEDSLISMAISQGTKKREAIRLMAQAAMCTAWIDREGILTFSTLTPKVVSDSDITSDELYNYDGVSVSPKVDSVVVQVKNEYADTEIGYMAGTGTNVVTVNNPCVVDSNGAAVANWLLLCYNRRSNYKVKNRCDPAVEIADTVGIENAYEKKNNAVVTDIDIEYKGSISAITTAKGQ